MAQPRLRKRLGQHHLTDGALCRPAIEFLSPAGMRVVEIGPGGGALTAELLAAGARVVGIELDLAWAFALRRRLADPRLSVAVADGLAVPWHRFPPPTLAAGNLPYGVGTALIAALLPHGRVVPRAAFLLQREVAERLVARPGQRPYGALSVRVAAYAEVRLLARVRPGSFRPRPKVEGAFVGLTLKDPPLAAAEMEGFLATVHLAFGQRRKTLRNALAAGWGRAAAAAALAAASLPAGARAEELSLADFLCLHRARAG